MANDSLTTPEVSLGAPGVEMCGGTTWQGPSETMQKHLQIDLPALPRVLLRTKEAHKVPIYPYFSAFIVERCVHLVPSPGKLPPTRRVFQLSTGISLESTKRSTSNAAGNN